MNVSPGTMLFPWSPRRQGGASRTLPLIFPPLLVSPHLVEGIKDIAAVFHGVVLRAVEPVGPDHVKNLILVRQLPFPRVADDVAPCRPSDPLAKTEDRIDVGLEVSSAVPAEDKLVGVDVDMLVADAVIGSVAPSLEVGEEPMQPMATLHGRMEHPRRSG